MMRENLKSKKIIVLGGLGVSARRDRCVDRILCGGGTMFSIPSHASVDKPMIVKKYKNAEKNNNSRRAWDNGETRS